MILLIYYSLFTIHSFTQVEYLRISLLIISLLLTNSSVVLQGAAISNLAVTVEWDLTGRR